MKQGLPWYKREPRPIIDAIREKQMSARQAAIYNLVLDLIYEGGGSTPNTPRYFAAHFSDISTKGARQSIDDLVTMGKLIVEGDHLTQKRAKIQAKSRENLAEKRADAGRKGAAARWNATEKLNDINGAPMASANGKTMPDKKKIRQEVEDGGGDARARAGTTLLDEIAETAKADLRRMEWLDFNLRPAVDRWMALGLDENEVRETVRGVMASRRDPGPVASPRYFDTAMQRVAGEKHRPALQPIEGGRSGDTRAEAAALAAHPHVDIDAILKRREQKNG